MLILSRRSGESLVIGENVTVTLLSIRGQHARIGIEAPKDVSIHRLEVYVRIKSEGSRKELRPKLSTPE